MARSRSGRKSNIGKKKFYWSEPAEKADEQYSSNMKKREFLTSTLHRADSDQDRDTYLFVAKSLKLDMTGLVELDDIRQKVWEEYKELSTGKISYLYDLFNPSYEK